MKMLYHPKRILGFEPYVAPTGFDRKAQPVDIYDVFERYYRHHRDAKYIYSVKDAATYTILEHPLTPSDGGITTGTTWRVSYELSGTRYYEEYGSALLNENIAYGSTVNTITVNDTSGFPDTGTIMIGGSYYSEYYNWKFTYTSKDSTHFYGTSQTIGRRNNVFTGTAVTLRYTWQGTKRYVIVKHSSLTWMKARCEGMGATTPTIEWMYCGNWIASVGTSDGAGALSSSCKYIHIHKLSNITRYNYGCHRGTTTLTGKIYLSPSVVYLTPSATDSTAYDIYPGAFTGCSGITEALEIPDQMIVIGGNSFAGTNIPSVTFHNNLVDIRMTAFYRCVSLNGTLTIPDSCLSIGNQAFYNCNKLDTLDLGEGVQTIGISAFQSCSQLSGTLTLPDSLTTIGTLAFYGCTSFSGTLTIPANITSIGQGAFGDDNFSDIDVTANSRYEDVDDVLYEISTRTALHSIKSDTGTITFQTNTLIIGDYCCLRNQRTGTLTVPDSVTRVGIYAFYDCDGFTALDLETTTSNLVTIGSSAFSAVGLTGNIAIPNSVETIGASAFAGDTALTGTLTLGTGLKTIGSAAFGNVPFTGTLTIPSAVAAIGEGAFYNNNFTSISSSATGFTVSDYVLYDETASGQIKAHTSARGYTGTLTFKAGTTSVLSLCLCNNDNRSGAIVIPYTVTVIGTQSFDNCGGFNSTVTIGDTTNGSSLTTIGKYAFRSCPSITEWNIYRTPAPTCNNSFSAYAKPLHVKSGATGYNVTPATAAAPWTNTAIFSSVTYDL